MSKIKFLKKEKLRLEKVRHKREKEQRKEELRQKLFQERLKLKRMRACIARKEADERKKLRKKFLDHRKSDLQYELFPDLLHVSATFVKKRIFANINPDKGSKAPRMKGKRSNMVAKPIINLVNGLRDFESHFNL